MSDSRVTDEFAFIQSVQCLFQKYHRQQTLVANGDDAAVFQPKAGYAQVVCVDTIVEQIHFNRKTMTPEQIGHKALAINLSDLAAMGAEPHYFLASVAIPNSWSEQDVIRIFKGMQPLADHYHIDLLGGDTTSSPEQLMLTVTVLGEVHPQVKLLRSNARAGDVVFVTGFVGHSAAGLHVLLSDEDTAEQKRSEQQALVEAHQYAQPHIEQGMVFSSLAMQNDMRFSLNDISDGLASEAFEIATASEVDLVLHANQLPTSSALASYAQQVGVDALEWVLYGGEDFVLLGTMSVKHWLEVEKQFAKHDWPLHLVGRVMEGKGQVWLEHHDHKEIVLTRGYNHFKTRAAGDDEAGDEEHERSDQE